MRRIFQVISWGALAGTIVPPIHYFLRNLTLEESSYWMTIATIVWFVVTPLWMGRPKVGVETPV